MKLLLDMHAFLWFIDDNPRLSAKAKALLESDADLLLSELVFGKSPSKSVSES